MGLDMWLAKRRELPGSNPVVASQYQVEPVMQWRKANAIHRFFDERTPSGIENCTEYVFSRADIQELVDLIAETLDRRNDAGELLPTMPGFFFGSLEYDEWYWEDLERTRADLTTELEDAEPGDEFIYSAWW